MRDWRFLTNHGYVLLCVARSPGMRMRDIADSVGITERAAARIVAELVEGEYIARERRGTRNFYEVRAEAPMRHPLVQHHQIGEILAVLAQPRDASDEPPSDGRSERRRRERRRRDRRSTVTAPPK